MSKETCDYVKIAFKLCPKRPVSMSQETFNFVKRALELCQKRPVSMLKEADATQIGATAFLRVCTRARQVTNYTLQHTATHCVAVCCSVLQCVAVCCRGRSALSHSCVCIHMRTKK